MMLERGALFPRTETFQRGQEKVRAIAGRLQRHSILTHLFAEIQFFLITRMQIHAIFFESSYRLGHSLCSHKNCNTPFCTALPSHRICNRVAVWRQLKVDIERSGKTRALLRKLMTANGGVQWSSGKLRRDACLEARVNIVVQSACIHVEEECHLISCSEGRHKMTERAFEPDAHP